MTYTVPTHDPTTGAAIPSTWGDNVNSDLTALNNYFYAPLFPESSGMVDSNTAGMGYAIQQGQAGTPIVEYPVLQANGTVTSGRKWMRKMPPAYGGSLLVSGSYEMPVAGSGAFVVGVRVSALAMGGTLSAQSFSTQVKGTVTASTVARKVTAFSVAVPTANAPSLSAGVPVQIEIERLPADSGDSEGGTVNFVDIGLYFNLSGY